MTSAIGVVLYRPTREDLNFWSSVGMHYDVIAFLNGRSETIVVEEHPISAEFLRSSENVGLGIALNALVEHALERGFDYLIYFDQDSRVSEEMLKRLVAFLSTEDLNEVALLGPHEFQSRATGTSHQISSRYREDQPLSLKNLLPVQWMISAGAVHNLRAIGEKYRYKGDYFIDRLDYEFCFQLVNDGQIIGTLPGYHLEHDVGETVTTLLGSVQAHSPLRHYFIARNRILFYLRDHRKDIDLPFFKCISRLLYHFLKAAREPRPFVKIKNVVRGTFDGLRSLR